jgi:poly-gamma-glutamate synthesis protein (capsule biosynthesis protein)
MCKGLVEMGKLFIYGILGFSLFALSAVLAIAQESSKAIEMSHNSKYITLFMAGDVMTGRGIDQILPHPSNPVIYEPYIKDARDYVALAEKANGPIHTPVEFSYIWGIALEILDRKNPDIRLINLETSITTNNEFWPGKNIHYRMHPVNISCLTAAKLDYCSLANNHILDWQYAGLFDSLKTLKKVSIQYSGAGRSQKDASMPAVIDVPHKGRVIIFSWGLEDSGILRRWAASQDKPGVNLLPDLSPKIISNIKAQISAVKKSHDIVIASIHWGSNWGYNIPAEHSEFAHRLIDDAKVDLVYGHSSHHFKPLEVYKGKLIIYGAGDFLNDYEGISGYESFRPELALMYFATVDPANGRLSKLQMVPTETRRFKKILATGEDARWMQEKLNKTSKIFGSRVNLLGDNTLSLEIGKY